MKWQTLGYGVVRLTELRFVSREGMYLLLESATGERYQVLVDDALREAIRRGNQEVQGTSPKLIQQKVREGATIAELAEETGETEEYIGVFALPVLDELRFVLSNAKAIELPDDNRMVEFGILAEERLGPLEWAIKKTSRGWNISANGPYGEALWIYEPRLRQLEPMNTTAKALHGGDTRDLIRATVPVPRSEQPRVSRKEPARQTVKPIEEVKLPERAHAAAKAPEEAGASVLDLVEELRSRRAREQVAEEESPPIEQKPATATANSNTKGAGRGRTSLPSWDEIVLGTSTSEPDSN